MIRTKLYLYLVIGLGAILATACGSGSAQTGVRSASDLVPEDLLSVALNNDDVQALFPEPERWWPSLPEFNVGFSPLKSGQMPDVVFWMHRGYQQVSGSNTGRVETTLTLFEDEAAAVAGMRTYSEVNDEGGTTIDGPDGGDERRYFTRQANGDSVPGAEDPTFETTLRFRVGPIVGRMSIFAESGYEKPETLAMYAAPVVERIGALLDGRLKAAALPERIRELMPPESATGIVGPEYGSAAVPVESWALIDTSGDPEAVRERLRSLGAMELGLRRYGVEADTDQVIEVVLFPLADETAAARWVQGFIDEAHEAGTLSSGQTGNLSAFTSYDGSIYELQFAKGRLVGDVSCFAPFGETSSACEEPVRMLAEVWYAELPAD